jgi:PhnB protein
MPGTTITPYLMFGGRCDEALAFYRDALGAEVELLMRFDESPEPPPPGMLQPGFEKKVMHASFVVRGVRLMASDGCNDQSKFDGFRLSLAVPTEADARRAFGALAAGGTVQMPLAKTFWSPCYGMVTDRFGVGWMVTVPGPTG